jgi:hypothetical protein
LASVERSTERRTRAARGLRPLLPIALVAAACGSPSKTEALAIVQSDVKEDGSCVLPSDVTSQLKLQHTSKGACVPRSGAAKAKACLEALVAVGVTRKKDEAYMVAWPDDLAGVSFVDVPAYERRARNLLFDSCFELSGDLREGRFVCADAKADKVLAITKVDDARADVRYARAIALRPFLDAVDAACGQVIRPPADATVTLAKGETGWALAGRPDAD